MAVRAPALSNTQPAVAVKINSKPNQNVPHERPGRQVAAPCRWRQEAIPGTRMTSRKSAALGARTRLLEILCFQSLATAAHHVAPLDSPRARIALAAPDIATSWRRSGLVTSSAPRWSSPPAVGVNLLASCGLTVRVHSGRGAPHRPPGGQPRQRLPAQPRSARRRGDRGHRSRFRHSASRPNAGSDHR